MKQVERDYRAWLLSKSTDLYRFEETSPSRIGVSSETMQGEVNFYDINDKTVVELRLTRIADNKPVFFLHFELEADNLDHARSLAKEMIDTLEDALCQSIHHILLCCSCGITTTFFANKLNECAQQMELPYDFCAKSLEAAKETGDQYSAVLLAPQVAHQRQSVVEALPTTLVVELPGKIFGSYDAQAAMRLVVGAVSGARAAAKSDLRLARDYDHAKRVLAISFVKRADESTLSYRILDKGEIALSGMLIRNDFGVYMFNDLAATLCLSGYPIESFDAVGIAIPGMIDKGVLRMRHGDEIETFDIAGTLSNKWGIPVYVDNNATAAAAGCYVSQTEWDDVAFHAQAVGIAACDEGLVIGGLPRAGKAGFAGNLKYLSGSFSLGMSPEEAAWRYDGTRRLVAHYLEATICAVAPQAIFVWSDLLPDMDDLREELLKVLPPEAIPELIGVSDYDDLTLMGALSLALQRIG